jgi:thiosulfate reductase cytochrome b subunit
MIAARNETPIPPAKRLEPIHPRIVRITHWVNAIAMILMILSGWQIHNAYPTLPFRFPGKITLGGWLGGGLQWHFAAMWLLMANGLVYLTYSLLSGQLRRKLLPIRLAQLAADLKAALTGRLIHDDLAAYNAVQKLLYLGVIAASVLAVLTGLAIWKPVQLRELTFLFGDFDTARILHFLAMTAITLFLAVHVVMALLVPKSLRAMIRGR